MSNRIFKASVFDPVENNFETVLQHLLKKNCLKEVELFLGMQNLNYLSTHPKVSPITLMNAKTVELLLQLFKSNRDHVKFWLEDIIGVKELKAIFNMPNEATDKFLKQFLALDKDQNFNPF